MMNISRKFIQRCAIVYIALPTLVFLFSWLRPCIGIPVGIVAIFSVARILVASGARCQLDSLMPSCERVTVSIPVGLSFMALLLLWCILSGQGGFVPQDGDWHWRNALFRDLITREWPVMYPKYDRALVFYTGHWLPPALVIKALAPVGLSAGDAWLWGKILLLAWTYLGVLIVFVQMLFLLRAAKPAMAIALLAVFTFGDGLDIVGHACMNVKTLLETGTCGSFLLESWFWIDSFILAHHGALLSCVFHQVVVPWMAVLLIADRCSIGRVAFLVSLVLICGPLPAIGIAIIVFFLVARMVVLKKGEMGALVREAVSFENLVGMLAIGPVVAVYLTANPLSGAAGFTWSGKPIGSFFGKYAFFMLVEVGAYFAATWCHSRRNIWWWAVLTVLLMSPLITLGWVDFSMRVSVPAMLVLLMMVVDVAFRYWHVRRWLSVALGVLLVIGMAAPLTNMKNLLGELVVRGVGERSSDAIVTFNLDPAPAGAVEGYSAWYRAVTINYCCVKPENHAFYRWLARRRGAGGAP